MYKYQMLSMNMGACSQKQLQTVQFVTKIKRGKDESTSNYSFLWSVKFKHLSWLSLVEFIADSLHLDVSIISCIINLHFYSLSSVWGKSVVTIVRMLQLYHWPRVLLNCFLCEVWVTTCGGYPRGLLVPVRVGGYVIFQNSHHRPNNWQYSHAGVCARLPACSYSWEMCPSS